LAPTTDISVAVPDVVAEEQLRVMEYNVHGGMGGPGQFFATPARLDHLAATIRRENPDIVLLQELDHFAPRSNFIDTLGQLARRLQPTGAVMTPAIEKVNGRREGTGTLTFNGTVITDTRGLRIGDAVGEDVARRFCATADAWARVLAARVGRQWQPFGGVVEYQPRVATDAMVRTAAGNHVRVLSGHFSPPQHGVDEPRRQVDPVVATIQTWGGPTIVAADFNVRDGTPEFRREHEVFEAVGLYEATSGAPVNSDRVYASAHFASAVARKLATPAGEAPASDHVPVIVELTLRSGPGPLAHA
jgi:endonuclease/exonuclease/phosphatase family metal-dependent hydrolase